MLKTRASFKRNKFALIVKTQDKQYADDTTLVGSDGSLYAALEMVEFNAN